MSLGSLIVLILIAGACGFIASQIMSAKRVNIIFLIVLGFIGAWVGQLIARTMHLPGLLSVNVGGQPFPLLWAILGSILVVGVVTSFTQHS